MKLNPFRWRVAPISAFAPKTTKQAFGAPAPRRSAPEPPRMYSLMLPSFTDRK